MKNLVFLLIIMGIFTSCAELQNQLLGTSKKDSPYQEGDIITVYVKHYNELFTEAPSGKIEVTVTKPHKRYGTQVDEVVYIVKGVKNPFKGSNAYFEKFDKWNDYSFKAKVTKLDTHDGSTGYFQDEVEFVDWAPKVKAKINAFSGDKAKKAKDRDDEKLAKAAKAKELEAKGKEYLASEQYLKDDVCLHFHAVRNTENTINEYKKTGVYTLKVGTLANNLVAYKKQLADRQNKLKQKSGRELDTSSCKSASEIVNFVLENYGLEIM